jgi:DNA-binding HxlR family transcriptional regulator
MYSPPEKNRCARRLTMLSLVKYQEFRAFSGSDWHPMAKQDTMNLGCPVARTAELIGNKWTPLIIRDLVKGEKRFSELERSLRGISPKTLSERLKKLEEAEVVTRTCYAEVPPRVEYMLTGKGTALLPVIESMRAYGSEWLPECDDDIETSHQESPEPALA